MKKIIRLILWSGIAISRVYANESALQNINTLSKKYPNNIYFGIDAFVFDLNTHFKGVKAEGCKFFIGLHLGYEYLKPSSFYFGTDLVCAEGNKSFHESYKHNHFPQSNEDTTFANLEFRFGYTFANQKNMITPFLGFGAYNFIDGSTHHYFNEGMGYYTGGIKYKRELTPALIVGLNAKLFASDNTRDKFRFGDFKRSNHHGRWGGEIGVPIIWYLGLAKKWDVQLEPYFLKLDFSQVQNIYGTRLLFDYRF